MRPLFLGLLRRRACLLPTWRGWLALVLAGALAGAVFVHGVHGFLALQEPVRGGVLVVEGWVPDYVLAVAAEEFQRGGFVAWCVTGEPVGKGAPLAEFHDYALLTVAAFEKAGGPPGLLQPVPWEPVRRDRTYASALALKAWLAGRGLPADRIEVVTTGVHARRSRLLYARAFGPAARVGVVAAPDPNFDPARWWSSSAGVRAVVDESVAYLYARCFFRGR